MNRWTKHPQNACRRCNYTWYPRGKHISHRCPRCGSQNVELAITAFFRVIAEMVLALFQFCRILILAMLAIVRWLLKSSGKAIRGVYTLVVNQVFSLSTRSKKPSSLRSSLPVPHRSSRSKTGSLGRLLSGLRSLTATFFAWVASVNDDLTGVNNNPHAFGVLAKILVIFALAAIAFVGIFFISRSFGLI
jgi:predicted RNA-binding Zn-ribbon protein involved in translation (DUF1610 family)